MYDHDAINFYVVFSTFFFLFSEPVFIRLILYISTEHFVVQCFDIVGSAM